LGSGKKVVELN